MAIFAKEHVIFLTIFCMKIKLLVIGKTDDAYVQTGIQKFELRLKHYVPFEIHVINDLKNSKNLTEIQQKTKEGELILAQLETSDTVILLDENGTQYTSRQFSEFIQKHMLSGAKNLFFIIGGPYGFSPEIYARANGKISLSKMTFSHQMVRLIFIEQLYRAMTILKNEPYHHD